MSLRLVGSLLAIAAALLWGTSWVATGVALRAFDPLAVAAWRGIGTTLLMALLLGSGRLGGRLSGRADGRADGVVPPMRGRLARLLVLALLGGVLFVIGMSLSISLTGATMTAFIGGLYPVVAAVAAPLVLPERPSRVALGSLVVAFAGILVLAGFDPTGFQPLGLVIGLGVASSFAGFLLLTRRWSGPWHLSAPVVTLANFALLSLVAGPLAMLMESNGLLPSSVDPGALLAILWLWVGAGVLAHLFVIGSVRRLPAHESSAYLLLNPLIAALLAAPLLDERLSPVQLSGAVLVLTGIAVATILGARASRSTMRGPDASHDSAH